jgi:hypothetical protein
LISGQYLVRWDVRSAHVYDELLEADTFVAFPGATLHRTNFQELFDEVLECVVNAYVISDGPLL